ncbi:MAG: hypothetical protein IMZ71_00870 [Chloroflexi bacterium]|nr:hypothetical protein [Chloroflexota bacterium]
MKTTPSKSVLTLRGKVYGYFQPPMKSNTVALERIDATASEASTLSKVLLIFVARNPRAGGQVVVGWYRNATIQREVQGDAPYPVKGGWRVWNAKAKATTAVLLHDARRTHQIKSGAGGFGESNVCYPLEVNGSHKQNTWMAKAIDFVERYDAPNAMTQPELSAVKEAIDGL